MLMLRLALIGYKVNIKYISRFMRKSTVISLTCDNVYKVQFRALGQVMEHIWSNFLHITKEHMSLSKKDEHIYYKVYLRQQQLY